MSKPLLLLNFIMKNEAKNLPRMLAALAPHIVGVAVTDTGSTDDSVALVADFCALRGLYCKVDHCEFIDYSHARNQGLRNARAVTEVEWEYLLLCDPDMELMVTGKVPKLTEHMYALLQDNGYVKYWNIRLIRRDQTIEYVGYTHETLTPKDPPHAIGGMWYWDHCTGANRPEKYTRDFFLLKKALEEEPLDARATFYMIQTLHGLGKIEEARQMCDHRVKLGGMGEEVWWSLLQMARFDEQLKVEAAQIEHEYMQAYLFRPTRCESLWGLGRWHRDREEWHAAIIYLRLAAMMSLPSLDVLSIESAIYDWMALDDWLGVSLIIGDRDDAKFAAMTLAKRPIPKAERDRIRGNIVLALGEQKTRKLWRQRNDRDDVQLLGDVFARTQGGQVPAPNVGDGTAPSSPDAEHGRRTGVRERDLSADGGRPCADD